MWRGISNLASALLSSATGYRRAGDTEPRLGQLTAHCGLSATPECLS